MLNQDILEKIKEEVKEFFEKMTFEVEMEILPQKEETLPLNVKSEEPQILIGERGETLSEIQYLLKMILKRKLNIEDKFYLDMDVNDYKKKKIAYLKEMARNLAEEVSLTKQERTLPPMSSYERRIVHMELADFPNVVSESSGEEPERRIIVKPSF